MLLMKNDYNYKSVLGTFQRNDNAITLFFEEAVAALWKSISVCYYSLIVVET